MLRERPALSQVAEEHTGKGDEEECLAFTDAGEESMTDGEEDEGSVKEEREEDGET